jgi:hypothetical protein
MNAAERIIELCGGPVVVAEICGTDISTVYRWTYPLERGGTGGTVPAGRHQRLLSGARLRGIDLRPEHFFDDLPPVSPPSASAADFAENAKSLPANESHRKEAVDAS